MAPINLIAVKGLTKPYSDRVLLDQVDMLIYTGGRIGLIGLNGNKPPYVHEALFHPDCLKRGWSSITKSICGLIQSKLGMIKLDCSKG